MDLNNLVSKIEDFQLNPIVGIDFGFKNLKTQEVLSCISKGDSYVVVAGSGVGKTALCIDKFVNTPVEFCRKNNIRLSKGV